MHTTASDGRLSPAELVTREALQLHGGMGYAEETPVSRYFVEARVLQHMQHTQEAVSDYQNLEKQRSSIQITFAMIFVMVTLLILVGSTWMGLYLAKRITRPVQALALAAREIGEGRLELHPP